jgi:hypothetical protein
MIIDADLIDVGVKMLTGYLYEGHVKVVFTKKDGSERTMICTKQLALIPEAKHPKHKPVENSTDMQVTEMETQDRDPHIITVFDVEKQDWRSFRYTTIKSIDYPDRLALK